MSRKFWPLVVLIVALALAALACNFGAPTPSTPETSTSVPQGTTVAQATSGTQPTAEAGSTSSAPQPTKSSGGGGGAATRSIDNIKQGLDNVTSYSASMTMNFQGKDENGKDLTGKIDMIDESIQETKSRHVKIAVESSNETGNGTFEIFKLGETSYMYTASNEQGQPFCLSMEGQNTGLEDNPLFQADQFLGSINDANLVESGVTVNGFVTDHYAFDQSNVTSKEAFTSIKGDFWVAQDGGYVVKYTATIVGKLGGAFGSSSQDDGTMDWEYNLNKVNESFEITLPDECKNAGASEDIPVPDNATDKTVVGGQIIFKSPDAPDQVAQYYRDELVKLDWVAGDETAMGDLFILNYTKDNRKLSITISKDQTSGGSSVLISETK
jgi:outer membrane lipoprotein-sorting protein